MAKRKTTNAETTKPRARVGQNLNVWLPDHLMDAFEFLRQKHKRTAKAECEVMLERYIADPENREALQRAGLWPPSQEQAE